MNRKTIRILMLLLVAMSLGIGEAKAEDNVKYIDADGVEKTQDNVTVLEGSSSVTDLPGGWYIVTGNNISYTNALSFDGDTYLILADGAELTAETVMMNDNANLTIYSQGGKTLGKEEGKFTSNNEMICGDLIINGGKVSALSPSNGWKSIACVNMIVNGGEVYATTGATFDACIACSGNMTINGGQLTAIRNSDGFGIDCKGVITFGWTKSKDFIKCSSYSVGSSGTVKTATGKRFDAYTYDGSGKETFSTTIEGGMTIDASGLTTTVLRPANYIYGVKYLKPNASGSALVEDQTSEGVKVWELIGDETELGTDGEETWYVTSGTTTFTSTITLKPGVHIILADGTTMTVPLGFEGNVDNGDIINIYSQGGTDEGKLIINANATAGSALWIAGGYITINGGIINITAVNDGIRGGDRITFNGGKTEITSSGGNGINSYDLIVNGGQLTVTSTSENKAGINMDGGAITLGWTNPTDYIKCSSYKGTVKTADDKSFAVYDGNDFKCVIGAASGITSFNNSIGSLSNKKLCPFEGKLVPVGSDKYYAYNLSSGNYKPLNPGVSVYLVTGIAYNQSTKQYEAVLSDAQPGVVSGVPVIFGVTSGNLPESIALENDATVSLSATPSENFIACNGTKKVSELLPSGVNFADVYFFGLSGNSFKRVLLGSDDVHPAGTCFLFIPKDDFNNPPSSAPAGARGIGIETDGTTSLIGNGQLTTDHAASAQWYSLDGRRLDKAPKTKGVYIRNGKKLVIK